MAFKNLREFYKPGLDFPVGDKVYHVASPTAEHGLRLRMLFSDPEAVVSDDDQMREIATLLGAEWDDDAKAYVGGVWSEMIGDGVTWEELMKVGNTALINYGMNESFAEAMWLEGGEVDGSSNPAEPEGNSNPAEPEPNRAARRATEKPKKATSSKAGGGSTTRGRARTAKPTPAAETGTQTSASDPGTDSP